MTGDIAIRVDNITKSFKVHLEQSHSLKDYLVFHNRNKVQIRNVINGISFDVKKGEAVALIGKNGCGKSTTLKMLTKILRPDAGNIEMKGRVSSLIELGAGFHPDMTGRENVYINASIFGLKKKEIDERLEDIIRFSELEEFIDQPVRTYSSGMYMRLAFSVAINVSADILLIDEILAVGDSAFQRKCFNKLAELKENGMTIVIVSHSLEQVKAICDRAIWIWEGVVRENGNPNEVCTHYLDEMDHQRSVRHDKEVSEKKKNVTEDINEEKKKEQEIEMKFNSFESCKRISKFCSPEAVRKCTGKIYFTNVIIKHEEEETQKYKTDNSMTIEFEYESSEENIPINIAFGIVTPEGVAIYRTNTLMENNQMILSEKKGKLCCKIDKLKLIFGKYYLEARLWGENDFLYDSIARFITFDIETDPIKEYGYVTMKHTWEVESSK